MEKKTTHNELKTTVLFIAVSFHHRIQFMHLLALQMLKLFVLFVQINLIKIYCNITPEKILDLSGKDCLFRNFHLFSFCKIASFGVFTNRNKPWQN